MSNSDDMRIHCNQCGKDNRISDLKTCIVHTSNALVCVCYREQQICDICKIFAAHCPDCLVSVRRFGLQKKACLSCYKKIPTTCTMCNKEDLAKINRCDVEGSMTCMYCIQNELCADGTKLFSCLGKCTKCQMNVASVWSGLQHDLCGKCCKTCDSDKCRCMVYISSHTKCDPHHGRNSNK